MKKPILSEAQIHKAVIQHIRKLGASGLVYWHTPNDARRTPGTYKRLQSMGMRAGVSDLLLLHNGILYALELKREKGNKATEAQVQFCIDVIDAGGFAYVAYGLDAALGALRTWGLTS